jgi:hypothetical protein
MAQETWPTSLGPPSCRRCHSTRDPPHEQWLEGLGQVVCCPLSVVRCCLLSFVVFVCLRLMFVVCCLRSSLAPVFHPASSGSQGWGRVLGCCSLRRVRPWWFRRLAGSIVVAGDVAACCDVAISTCDPPCEQWLAGLGAGAGLSLPLWLSFHPRSTPRAVAHGAGGRWCVVPRQILEFQRKTFIQFIKTRNEQKKTHLGPKRHSRHLGPPIRALSPSFSLPASFCRSFLPSPSAHVVVVVWCWCRCCRVWVVLHRHPSFVEVDNLESKEIQLVN